MDEHGHIYEAHEDEIPAEDKARLDGYLRGRAEAEMEQHSGYLERLAREKARDLGLPR